MLEHGGRSRAGVFFNFNGTGGMWRRQAIDDAGGRQHDTLTEDTDLQLSLAVEGLEISLPSGRGVSGRAAHRNDRLQDAAGARWAKGLIQCAKKDLPKVLRAPVSKLEKIEAWYHLTANLSYPLMIVLSTLLLPAMVIWLLPGLVPDALHRPAPVPGIDVFHLQASTWFRRRSSFLRTWYRTFLFLPALMALGIGLTITNAKAVFEALVGKQTAFARTPKVSRRKQTGQRGWASTTAAKKYRKRLGWIPYIQLLIGTYFALTVWYAIANENYFTVPFLFLFVFGYWYTGLMSLLQGRFDALVQCARRRAQPPNRFRSECKAGRLKSLRHTAFEGRVFEKAHLQVPLRSVLKGAAFTGC